MARTKIVHNSAAYAALIKHPNIQADIDRRTRAVAAAAGPGFYAQSSSPHTRARGAVVAPEGDPDNKMIRALDAGR